MPGIVSKDIYRLVETTTTEIDIMDRIYHGDVDAYNIDIEFYGVISITGTCNLHFVLSDGTALDKDASDGVVIDGKNVKYTLPTYLYQKSGNLTMYVQFMNSNIYTPLKVNFKNIVAIPYGGEEVVETTTYPVWYDEVVTNEDERVAAELIRISNEVSRVTAEDARATTGVLAAIDELATDIGARTYTEQNYVTNGETVTASIDAIDTTVASHKTEVNSIASAKADITYVDTTAGELAQDITVTNSRIDNIVATPTTVSEQEIMDARSGEASLGAKILKMDSYADLLKKNLYRQYYRYGNECTDLTEGWVQGYLNTYTTPTITKEADHILISETNTGGIGDVSVVTSKKVDITNADTLFIDWEQTVNAASSRANVALGSVQNNTRLAEPTLGVSGLFTRRITSLDVSGYTGEWYIRVHAASVASEGSSSVKVYNVFTDEKIARISDTNELTKEVIIVDEKHLYHKAKTFDVSTNILDTENYTPDTTINASTGELAYNLGNATTDFVPIKPNTTYTSYHLTRKAFYDHNKVFIYSDLIGGTWTSPANAYYIRWVSPPSRFGVTAQLNEGSVLLPFEPFYIQLRDESIKSKNATYYEVLNVIYKDDYYMIDTNINAIFNKNVVIPDSSTTVAGLTSSILYSKFDELMNAHPTYITKTLLGNEPSPSALPLYRYDFKPTRPDSTIDTKQIKMIVVTGTHPEKTANWSLYNLLNNMCNNWKDNSLLEALRFNVHFIIVPVGNPWGFDNASRTNYNQVDIERNFEAGWTLGTLGDPYYGGTEPLSEIETNLIDTIMKDNTDALGVIDFHNFASTENKYIWGAVGNEFSYHVMRDHIQQMTRKWQKEHTFLNQSYDFFVGLTNPSPGGSIGYQADAYGFKLALTYEVGPKVFVDVNSTNNDSMTSTFAYEAWTNFLLKSIHQLLQHQ